MKVTELRIGNTLQRSDGSIFNVTIHDLELIHTWIANERLLPQGIPLTEEWLLKFGLTQNEYGFFAKDHELNILFDLNDNGIDLIDWEGNTITTNKIQYVHQFQNLYFDLTDEELIH